MPSEWILYVKSVAKEKGIKYGEALKVASKTYKKKTKGTGNTPGGMRRKTEPIEEDYDDKIVSMETKKEQRKREEAKESEKKPTKPDRINSGNVKDPRHKRFKAK